MALRLFAPLRLCVKPLCNASIRILLILLTPFITHAQTIYTTVLGNQNHVVGSSTLRSGLFVSYDGATTWKHIGPENLKGYSMDAVDTSKGRILYLAAGNGVHRSTDYGKTWKIVTDWRMTEVLDVKVDQKDPNYIYAATAWGFWRSLDRGDTWENPDGPLKEKYCYRLELSASNDTLWIVGESSLWHSTNRGTSWEIDSLPSSPRHLFPPSLLPEIREAHYLYGKGDDEECRTRRLIVTVWCGIPNALYDADRSDSGTVFAASERGGMRMSEDSCISWVQWGWQDATHAVQFVPGYRLWLFGTFGNGMVVQKLRPTDRDDIPDFLTRSFVPELTGSQIWRIIVKNYTVPEKVGHGH